MFIRVSKSFYTSFSKIDKISIDEIPWTSQLSFNFSKTIKESSFNKIDEHFGKNSASLLIFIR